MNMLDRITGSTTALTHNSTRGLLESASAHLPQWMTAGAALAIARTGSRVALGFARRNPALVLAAGVVGAGALAYNAYRKRKAASPLVGTAAQNGANDAFAPVEIAAERGASSGRARKPTARRAQRVAPANVAQGDEFL